MNAGFSAGLMSDQTELEDCADAFVATAKNASITGQTIQIGKLASLFT